MAWSSPALESVCPYLMLADGDRIGESVLMVSLQSHWAWPWLAALFASLEDFHGHAHQSPKSFRPGPTPLGGSQFQSDLKMGDLGLTPLSWPAHWPTFPSHMEVGVVLCTDPDGVLNALGGFPSNMAGDSDSFTTLWNGKGL